MANLIQIKRSGSTDAPADGGLIHGELAYSFTNTSNSLFIGNGSNNAVRIGGGKYLWLHQANVSTPGALTANAVIITNGNSFVTELKSNKLIVGSDGQTVNVTSVSLTANSTQLGNSAGGSNTELVSSYAIKTYVDGKTASLGGGITNTQIVYSDSGTLSGSAAYVFNNTTNTVSLGANVTISPTTITVGNSTVNAALTATSFDIDGTINSGNTTVTGFANISSTLAAGNTTVTGFANISSTLAAGNTTVTGFANISSTLAAGNTTVTGFANISSTLAAGNTTVTGFANISSTIQVGGNALFNGAANVEGLFRAHGDVIFGDAATDNVAFTSKISTSIIPYHGASVSLGNSSLAWQNLYVGSINATSAAFSGDVSISGNLVVSGNLTTIETTNIFVEDPLIHLARENNTTDTVDIGIFGTFGNATVTQTTGFFRDASDGIYKLFTGEIPTLNTSTTVDTANINFAFAPLKVGDFEASKVTTANAQITGGSITGITDLTVADGGTGVSVFANNGILYGQNTSALAVTAAGTEGQVLTVVGGIPAFASLDGGSF